MKYYKVDPISFFPKMYKFASKSLRTKVIFIATFLHVVKSTSNMNLETTENRESYLIREILMKNYDLVSDLFYDSADFSSFCLYFTVVG